MDAKEIKHLGYDLERVIVYHDIRRAFNNRWNSMTLGMILFLGSGSFATVLADDALVNSLGVDSNYVLAFASLLSAALGFVQLVAKFQERAGKHELVLKEYGSLLARYRDTADGELEDMQQIKREYEQIDSSFETNFRAVNMVSYNQIMERKGLPQKNLSLGQRVFMNYGSFSRAKFS